MSFIWNFAICAISLLVMKISQWLYRWSNPKCNGKLPPGSMGFPIIGETIEFFTPHGFYEISPFIKKRMIKYGPLFRTNIFGSKTVVTTDPDVIFDIFRQENKSFIFSYPDDFAKVFGKGNLLVKHGNIHKRAKQITLQLLSPEGLKRNMIRDMDRTTREHLMSMTSQGTLDVKEAIENLILSVLIPNMMSKLKPKSQRSLMDNLLAFNLDWFNSLCTLTTWKSLYKAIMARRAAMQVINDIFCTRIESREKHGDFLNTMLEDDIFDKNSALNHIFTLPVIAKDTTSIVTSLAVKFIAENPKVLAGLKREHKVVLQNRVDKGVGVSWEEYRHNMTFTNMVINESLRLANLSPVMFRKAAKDVEIKGYTIPAGWVVAVAPTVVHFDPAIYENPLEFNPWRWEGKDLLKGSKTFMVFGGGVRQCVGAEFARLQIAMFLHYLVTNYDFSLAQECEVMRTPLPSFLNGIQINISHSSTE